jgi:hypothetical protein
VKYFSQFLADFEQAPAKRRISPFIRFKRAQTDGIVAIDAYICVDPQRNSHTARALSGGMRSQSRCCGREISDVGFRPTRPADGRGATS